MTTPNSSTSKLKRYGIPAALVAGGVTFGTIFAPIGLASADEADNADDENTEDSTEENTEDNTEESKFGRRGHHFSRGGAKTEAITDVLGLSAEELREGFDAGKSVADLAAEQDVPVEDVKAAILAAINEQIDEAVAEGHIDSDKADEAKANLEERIDDMLDRVPSQDRDGHRAQGRGGKGHGRMSAGLENLSEVLGLSEDEVKAGLADGKSLAELGEEQGVSAETLADHLVADAEARIDDKVAEGDIDAEKAAELKEELEARIEGRINGEMPERGEGRGDREGWGDREGRGRRGPFGGTDRGAPTDSGLQETSF